MKNIDLISSLQKNKDTKEETKVIHLLIIFIFYFLFLTFIERKRKGRNSLVRLR